MAFDDENILTPKEAKRLKSEPTDIVDVFEELGIGRKKKQAHDPLPVNKYWLHDTPGAINDAQVNILSQCSVCIIYAIVQLINLLTTKELKFTLSKKPLKPRTFILKPEQCLFIGGLARLDYLQVSYPLYSTCVYVYILYLVV